MMWSRSATAAGRIRGCSLTTLLEDAMYRRQGHQFVRIVARSDPTDNGGLDRLTKITTPSVTPMRQHPHERRGDIHRRTSGRRRMPYRIKPCDALIDLNDGACLPPSARDARSPAPSA